MSSGGGFRWPLPPLKEDDQPATRFAKDHLKAFVERVERLEEEKKTIADDIRDVYAEAKATGFDVKALRTIVRLRKQDVDERKEHEAILETYMHALGMLVIDDAMQNDIRQIVMPALVAGIAR